MTKVAVIGAGVAGLSAAWHLTREAHHRVALFEAADYFGGHAHTVDVSLPDGRGRVVTHGVDTGFLVFNHRTYPRLVALFDRLGVETAAADMSFSVQSLGGLAWSGTNLNSVFAQRRNLVHPGFWWMLVEVLRFNRLATRLASTGSEAALPWTVGEFLDRHRFSASFRRDYFLPMVGCIWSCPTEQMLSFPVSTLIRFCHNHGLLQVADRPQWYTVAGGSRRYVTRMVQDLPDARLRSPVRAVRRDGVGVTVLTEGGQEVFDAVVFACHSDQVLQMLGAQATDDERATLGAIRYHPNRAVLHTDAGVLPSSRRAWAAWNYEQAEGPAGKPTGVCLHYLINLLQPLPFAQPVIVSMNPARAPRPEAVLASFDYAHPVFDQAALAAQAQVPALQGQRRTWYCGAWTGYGFHEDGLASGQAVARALVRECAGLRASPAATEARAAA